MHSMCGWSLQQKNTTPKSKVCNIPQPTLQKSTSLAWMTWRCFNLQVTQPKQDSTGLIHKNDRWFGFSCHFKQAPDLGNNQSVGHVGLCQAGHVSSWRSSNTLTYLRVWKKKNPAGSRKPILLSPCMDQRNLLTSFCQCLCKMGCVAEERNNDPIIQRVLHFAEVLCP